MLLRPQVDKKSTESTLQKKSKGTFGILIWFMDERGSGGEEPGEKVPVR